MATETLYATSLTSGSVATSTNALGAPNGTFTTDTGATSWTARFAMGDPTNGQANGTHTVTVKARKISGQSGTPTLDSISLYEGATLVQTNTVSTSVTNTTTGQDVATTFADTLFAGRDLTNIEIQVATTAAGGSPGVRTPVQIDSITWSGDFTVLVVNYNGGATPGLSVTATADGTVAAGAADYTGSSSSSATVTVMTTGVLGLHAGAVL